MKGGTTSFNLRWNPTLSIVNKKDSAKFKEYFLDIMSILLLIFKLIFLFPFATFIIYVLFQLLSLIKNILISYIFKGAKMIFKAKALDLLLFKIPKNPITILFGLGYMLAGVLILCCLLFIICILLGPLLRLFNFLLIISPYADKPAYGPGSIYKSNTNANANANANNNSTVNEETQKQLNTVRFIRGQGTVSGVTNNVAKNMGEQYMKKN